MYVPGSEFSDTTDVPHGSVAAVTYRSNRLWRLQADAHLYATRVRNERKPISRAVSAPRREMGRKTSDEFAAAFIRDVVPYRFGYISVTTRDEENLG